MPGNPVSARVLALLLTAVLTAACTSDGDPDPGAAATSSPSGSASAPGGAGDGGSEAAGFDRIPEIVDQVQPSVVTVLTAGGGLGSGVVYDSDGVLVTNAHVVGDASTVRVAFADGTQLDARVTATDVLTDLAVLEVDRDGLPAAEFEQQIPPVGELAIAIGSPLGFQESVTAGIISGINRDLPNTERLGAALVNLIQTDAAISPGNSGGALVDEHGRVIGINDAYIPPAAGAVAIGFAIPAQTVVRVVDELLRDGEVSHVVLGVRAQTVTPLLARRFGLDVDGGAVVLQVEPGSPAASAGVEPGDILTALDGEPVRTVEDLLGRLANIEPGSDADLTIVRQGQEQTVTASFPEQ